MKAIRLPKPSIYSFEESLWFLDRGFDDCLHQVTSDSVIKAIRHEDDIILIEIKEDDTDLVIDLLSAHEDEVLATYITEFVIDWLDLKRDLTPFYNLAKHNGNISPLVSTYHGLRLIGIPDMFEAFCWCIIGQQINLTFAHKLKTALVAKYGESISHAGNTYHVFPKPEQLIHLTIDDLTAIQFSKQKADYVIGLAKIFSEDGLNIEGLKSLPSSKEMIHELCKIRGVGEWTANYVLMKTLKRMDCITYGDAGLLNGIKQICHLDSKPNRDELNEFFSGFEGWESYLVFYVWRTLT